MFEMRGEVEECMVLETKGGKISRRKVLVISAKLKKLKAQNKGVIGGLGQNSFSSASR